MRAGAFPVALVLGGLGIACGGCGDDGEQPEQTQARAEDEAQGPAEGRAPMYGPDGQLLESDEQVAGLTLPRGLELHFEQERRHVYYTRAPLSKVQQYFGPRLITGDVERVGDGATFREAVPREVRGGVVKLDVSIVPTKGRTRVEIREIRPAPRQPPPRADVARRLRERRPE